MSWPRMESRDLKTLSYTVEASRDQAERWEAAAARGLTSVGTWLGETADAHLRELARSGRATPLSWHLDRFQVLLIDDTVVPSVLRDVEVRGAVSGPFGIFRGHARGITGAGSGQHSLVHLPTHRLITTLASQKSCKTLAAELASLSVDWQEEDPEKVVLAAPDRERVPVLVRLFGKLSGM